MESRIRLEGRLELVERTAWALERGLRAAQRGDWAPLQQAIAQHASPEVQQALEQVQKMSAQDPALTQVLDRLWRLVGTAERRAAERCTKLRLPPGPLALAVKGLVDDPVVFTGRKSRRWMVQLAAVAAALGVTAISMFTNGHFPFYLVFIFVFALRSPKLSPMDVTVTRRRVLLKEETVALSDVVGAKFEERDSHAEKELPVQLVLTLKNGQRRVQNVPEEDARLVDALRGGGVPVETLSRRT